MSFGVRAYTEADWPAAWGILQPILQAGATYPQPPETSETEARQWWIDDHRAVYVAEDASSDGGGRVVGSYYLTDNKPGLGSHVANAGFIVAPSASGRGVGRAMGEHCLTTAPAHGYLALQFNLVIANNEASLRIWDAIGFTRVGVLPKAFRHATDGLVDAYVMYKWLGD